MQRLQNRVLDRWVSGAPPFRTLHDPSTEEPIAETSSNGLDFQAVLDHARNVGGPNLRAMTFAQRAACLEAMASALHAHRDELLDLSMANGGNTRSDAKFDVDGATFTLSAYARLGRELGDVRHLPDGEPEALGRSARFVGRHVRVPLPGAAVHINAFNFPAWGTFEKAAVALLAGVPVISKPATSTALLAERMVRIVVEADLLPPGALQLVVGSTGDLLELLDGRDALAFTGSADTAALLRGGRFHVERSARINVEADSLNAAVAGPDVEPGTPLFDALVQAIVLEMTQKAGQKCTAIRRVLVPRPLLPALRERLVEELAGIVVGDPRTRGVRMGPLATADQLRAFRAGVARLAREARIVYGSPTEVEPLGVPEGRGWFASPVLLEAEDARSAPAVHEVEVFGPVATLLPYDGGAEEAARIVALGSGSLVTSLYADDRDWLAAALPEMAACNGRVRVVDTRVADQATPHGMVLPNLVHGGPGRAGGGEELGGLRGLDFYLHRVAIQGNRSLLGRLLDR